MTTSQELTFKHKGKPIFLVGKPGDKTIWTTQHMFGDGSSMTIGLRMNTNYVVGGQDANGQIIPDFVYENFLLSEFNNSREKSKVEERLEEHEVVEGAQVTFAHPTID